MVKAETCCEHRVHEIKHARYLLRMKVWLVILLEVAFHTVLISCVLCTCLQYVGYPMLTVHHP
jgi:hypothetical protein